MNDNELLRRIQNIERKLGINQGYQGLYKFFLARTLDLPTDLNLLLVTDKFQFLADLDRELSDIPEEYEVTGEGYHRKFGIAIKWFETTDGWNLQITKNIKWKNSTMKVKGVLLYYNERKNFDILVAYMDFNSVQASLGGTFEIHKSENKLL